MCLPNKFTAGFARDDTPDDGVAWICCGDYQQQHIAVWRNAIIAMYGNNTISNMEKDENGALFFRYSDVVNMGDVAKKIGITHSGPSTSSSSTAIPSRNGVRSILSVSRFRALRS